MAEDHIIQEVYKKIDREKGLINGAMAMRQQTTNHSVQQSLDSQIREGRKNIEYLEGTLRELQMRNLESRMSDASMGHDDPTRNGRGANPRYSAPGDPPPPPPKGLGGPPGYDSGYQNQTANGYNQMPLQEGYGQGQQPFDPGPPQRAKPHYNKIGSSPEFWASIFH